MIRKANGPKHDMGNKINHHLLPDGGTDQKSTAPARSGRGWLLSRIIGNSY